MNDVVTTTYLTIPMIFPPCLMCRADRLDESYRDFIQHSHVDIVYVKQSAYSHNNNKSIIDWKDRNELYAGRMVKADVACQDQQGCPAAKNFDIDDYDQVDARLIASRRQDSVLTHLH